MNIFRIFQVVSVHTLAMATVFKNDNSPYWKARYLNAKGTRVSRSTKTKSKREAKKITEQFEAAERTNKNESLGLSVAYGKILQRVIRDLALPCKKKGMPCLDLRFPLGRLTRGFRLDDLIKPRQLYPKGRLHLNRASLSYA